MGENDKKQEMSFFCDSSSFLCCKAPFLTTLLIDFDSDLSAALLKFPRCLKYKKGKKKKVRSVFF
jgi:hypothetical protein